MRDSGEDNNRAGNWVVDTSKWYTPGEPNSTSTGLPAFDEVWINEIMPLNTAFADNEGEYEPWIELYNAGTNNVTLGGSYYLANSYTNLTNWAFPAGIVITNKTCLLIWADGETAQGTNGNLHAGYVMNSSSGSVALVRLYSGKTIIADWMDYSLIGTNRSYGLYPNGDPLSRQVFHYPTPGASNNPSSDLPKVYINEWMASNNTTTNDPADANFDDWFELYNASNTVVDLSGFQMAGSSNGTNRCTLPGGSVIPGKGFMVVWADKNHKVEMSGGSLHVNFQLNKSGDTIWLFTPDGTMVDKQVFGQQATDVAEGLWPDGTAQVCRMAVATPGSSNNPVAQVDNDAGATGVTENQATLHGRLNAAGGGPTGFVKIWWGITDGVTNTLAWSNSATLGWIGTGPFSTNITGLVTNTTYYYRCYATNWSGISWAHSTTNFRTRTTWSLVVTTPHGTVVPANTNYYYDLSSVTCSVANATVPDGAATQYVCSGWTGSGSVAPGSGTNTSFTITNNSTLAWQWTTNYQLTCSAGPNGTIDRSTQWVLCGSNVTINAAPSNGYHFLSWSGNTGSCTIAGAQITAPMSSARTITAGFEANSYSITASAGPHGTIAPSGTVWVLYGNSTNFVIQANAQYNIADVLIDGLSAGVFDSGSNVFNYTFTSVETNHTISATFNALPHLAVAVSPTNGPVLLKVTYDFAGSSDADNGIVRSEIDRDGDGEYECTIDGTDRLIVEYGASGTYTSLVRVVDGFGAVSSTSVVITVWGRGPTAVLTSTVANGPAPLTVNLAATNSYASADRELVAYEWDFDGDGSFDSITTTGSVTKAYTRQGIYDAVVRVTDNNGLHSEGSLVITVEAPAQTPPTAGVLTAALHSGSIPLDITYTADFTPGSGSIATYRWDFDGDGICDLVTAGSSVSRQYTVAGVFNVSVEAVDANNLSAAESVLIRAGEASTLKAWVTAPGPGFRISGSVVTVRAETAPGSLTEWIQLQYKQSASNEWFNLGSQIAPPDSFSTTWDTTGLTNGTSCDLRVLARDTLSVTFTSAVVTLTVDSTATGAVGETVEGEAGGKHVKTQLISKDESTRVEVYDGTAVAVPAGSAPSNVVLEVELTGANTNIINGSALGMGNVGANRKVSLLGNPELQLPVRVSIPYSDVNNDGLVDGTLVPESTLTAHWYDIAGGTWKRALDSKVYPDENRVELTMYHLTEIGLFGTGNLLYPGCGAVLSGFTSERSNRVAAANLTDGNIDSYWQSVEPPGLIQQFTYSFTNGLGAVLNEFIVCNHSATDLGQTNFSVGFALLGSMNGTDYTNMYQGYLSASNTPEKFVLGTAGCYSVRLAITSGVSAAGWELAEFGVYGSLTNDADSDLMPDAWELAYFGNYNSPGTTDSDGDGLSDFGEYVFGTDPTKKDTDGDGASDWQELIAGTTATNQQSVLRIETSTVSNRYNYFILNWPTVNGRWYDLWTAPLMTNTWSNLFVVPLAGNGGTMQYTNDCTGVQNRFFQVRVGTNAP